MSGVLIQGVGLTAPGLPGWEPSLPVLRGERAYDPQPLPSLVPQSLPANERRRATALVRLALAAAEQAMAAGGLRPGALRSVFASSEGDLEVVDRICETLAEDPDALSPTLFHNSVHNAPAGYWSIGTRSSLPSTSLSAFDASFTAGLMEAWSLLLAESQPVLLVAYDAPGQGALAAHRPMPAPFACALLLAPPHGNGALARLALTTQAATDAPLSDPGLEHLRRGNPAARALPLLQALARREPAALALPTLGGGRVCASLEA